ncbi:ras guanine nucleotide exchange factor domain-containing protein [Mycena vulgaris]|nr:ras guanine nucleotide exchange factor domain-containing protein [Mycena vulgaris]
MVPNIHRYNLSVDVLFPSLVTPIHLMRQMMHPEQLDQMKTLVTIFCGSVDSIQKSVLGDKFLLLSCVIYHHLNDSISLAIEQLRSHIESPATGDEPRTGDAMVEVMRLVDIVMRQLPVLIKTVGTFHRMKLKPLPALPVDELEDSFSPDEGAAHILDLSDDTPPLSEDGGKTSPESPTSDATESTPVSSNSADGVPVAQTTPKRKKHKFIRRVLQIPPEDSKAGKENTPLGEAASESPKSASASPVRRFLLSRRPPLAVVNPDVSSITSSTTTLVTSEAVDENPYIVRQSCIYDCMDPLRPDEMVSMPLPVGDTVAIRLDSNGDVRAASLPALIQLLTSHHALPVDELRETFFLSFRLFSSSHQVFAAIRARWDERPPHTGTALTPAQRRVWIQHVYHVRGCLARLLFVWLDEYWRPQHDRAVLADLRSFVEQRFSYAHLDEDFIALVFAAIERAEHQEHTSRLQRAMEVERQGAPPAVSAFDIELRPEDDYTLNIAVFETVTGRERFAGQITDLAHKLFRKIDPEDAVAQWVSSARVFFDLQKFEEELLFWVAQSILSLKNREERVAMIEFWLDVATICVSLRNFSSASSIFGGLVFSPVERLSLTILDIAIPKRHAAVPLMTVLHKDVISANEISGSVALTNEPDAAKTLIHIGAFRMLKRTICIMESCLVHHQDWIHTQLAVLPHAEHAALSQQMDILSRELEARAPLPIQKGQTWLQTVKGSVETGGFTLHTLPDPGAASLAPKLRKNKSIATLLNLRTRSK